MKFQYTFPILWTLCASLNAQTAEPDIVPEVDPKEVHRAIEEFNRSRESTKEGKANEVTVVLDPPSDTPKAIQENVGTAAADGDSSAANSATEKPLLVTGKPQQDHQTTTIDDATVTAPAVEAADSMGPLDHEKPGLEVRVESIRKGNGEIDAEQISLKTNFPPKPLAEAPSGWTLARSDDAPEYQRSVELQPGTTISLSIRPHVLEPTTDGATTFAVREPGFATSKAYLQTETVGAILSKSVTQLDEDSKKIGRVIEDLHQILASLPKPDESSNQPDNP